MPTVTSWSTTSDWNKWANFISSGEIRVVDSSLKLPFKQISHIGNGDVTSQEIARWRFGQKQSLSDQTGSGYTAAIPTGIDIGLVETGIHSPNRNGYLTVNEDSSFNLTLGGTYKYLSCWIKSKITDYSLAMGIICAHHIGVDAGNFSYALAVDTDNKVKAFIRANDGTTYKISPVGGSVTIDTNWHHLLLLLYDSSDSKSMLIVDNDFGNNAFDETNFTVPSGTHQFDICSSSFSPQYGFVGTIDELVLSAYDGNHSSSLIQVRFEQNIYVSQVYDTERDGSILATLLSEFEVSNDSSVTFSFRASDDSFSQTTSEDILSWSGFTSSGHVQSGKEFNVIDSGLLVKGRYQQIRVKMKPSDSSSGDADSLQLITPILISLESNTTTETKLILPSNPVLEKGRILGQIVNWSGSKKIDKVTLGLHVESLERKLFIVGEGGNAAFSAACFQDFRYNWVFQPILHWSGGWETSGTTLRNIFQSQQYADVDDAVNNAPFLSYLMFLDSAGEYDVWGYGFITEPGIFWSFDEDITHLRRFTLGEDDSANYGMPRWTKIGTIYSTEGGIHSFTVYLSDADIVILDQWLFTQNFGFNDELTAIGDKAFRLPIPNSRSPVTVALRSRSLTNGSLNALEDPRLNSGDSVTSWLTAGEINDSGLFNFAIANNADGGVTFEDGVSLEIWQIGGGSGDFVSWNYSFADTSAGSAFRSEDFGQTYQIEA